MPAAIIRNTGPRGPRFYEDGEELMFVNVVDASTRDGPRPATEADMEAHPEAVAALKSNETSTFPGAKPLITFVDPNGKRPPDFPDPEKLAKAPEPREEPEPELEPESELEMAEGGEKPKRPTLRLKTD